MKLVSCSSLLILHVWCFGWHQTEAATWPKGYYGLPKPKTGCPSGWRQGSRHHDDEDDDEANSVSPLNHFAGFVGVNSQQEFCIKDTGKTTGPAWPKGDYCIYQSDNHCPLGFSDGYVHMDDEDSRNKNNQVGYLPSGSYGRNTKYNYCCRNDGASSTAIVLPANIPFYLFQYRSSDCQKVSGMTVKIEWLHHDNEDSNNKNSHGGSIPKGEYGRNTKQFYCYYY